MSKHRILGLCFFTILAMTATPSSAQLGGALAQANRQQEISQAMDRCDALASGQGTRVQVIEGCSTVLRLVPDEPSGAASRFFAFGNRGRAHFLQGDYVRALTDFDQAIRLDSQNALIFAFRGDLYFAQRDYARAIADYGRAINLDPQRPDFFTSRGRAHVPLQDYERAIADFDQALRLDPRYMDALLLRSNSHERLGDVRRALADAEAAVRIDANSAWAHNLRCWDLALLNENLGLARASCDNALRLSPEYADALDSRALVHMRGGNFEAALTDYDAAVRLDPQKAHPLYGRGIARLRLGQTSQGRADIAAANAIDATIAARYARYGLSPTAVTTPPSGREPNGANFELMGPGELFARADELDQQGRADEARTVRRTLIARFPDSPLAATAAQQLAAPSGQ